MSHIVDALILNSYQDARAVAAMNSDLASRDEDRGQEFRKLGTNAAGGSKVFCAEVYAGAFNYVSAKTIEECFAAAPWTVPERVVLIVDPYDPDEDPRCFTASDLREKFGVKSR